MVLSFCRDVRSWDVSNGYTDLLTTRRADICMSRKVNGRRICSAIDNNVSEREMKRVVLNRKNSLFVGNPRGG